MQTSSRVKKGDKFRIIRKPVGEELLRTHRHLLGHDGRVLRLCMECSLECIDVRNERAHFYLPEVVIEANMTGGINRHLWVPIETVEVSWRRNTRVNNMKWT